MVRFAPEHVVLFLRLCDLGSKERHKATTRNGVPQEIGRPQHTPSQTDTVVRFVQEHVAVFLRLCELLKRGATRLLLATVFLTGVCVMLF